MATGFVSFVLKIVNNSTPVNSAPFRHEITELRHSCGLRGDDDMPGRCRDDEN